ncbi:periplasmic binding domain protein [Collimonas pratensis]|uniref:Periplasmic binding domain protein n=2 Tax=Collimonas pratensis TaxID=279113 RepID=A0A127QAJ5_9BURK|nr:periplasmic binding domain protein [Collimonas pratensis]
MGEAYRDGAQIYFEKINKEGGVNGRRIRLITLDDGYDAKRAQVNTKELIEQHQALALFGHMFSNTVFASLPLATAAGVPYVGPYAGNEALYAVPPNHILFMTRASYSAELDALLRHVQAMGLTRVALARYDSPSGAALQKDLEEKLKAIKLAPAGVATMRLNSAQAADAVLKIVKIHPQAIVLGVSGDDAVAFVRQFNQAADKFPVQFFARSLIGGHQLVVRLGSESRGIVISQVAPSPFNGETHISREYQAALKTTNAAGRKLVASYIGLDGYIAAKVMVEGLRRAGPNPSRPALTKALETMHHWDAGDFVVNYDENDHAGSKFVTVTVIGAGGHFIE